jgi:eukaryotic-like serine/threonine-protein kinase
MIGSVIEHYKLVSLLGEGGMGVVYKAFDLKLERYVALKILTQQSQNKPQFIERFKREAKNQAKLNHPNIVPVYGFTESRGYFGIVMEYVSGETLGQIIQRFGRLEIQETVNIIKQVLTGASYAHSKGFVHRDIKPSNIILNDEGVAKIMDFGISKSLNDVHGITKTGTKLGTILYMSPEQIKSQEPTPQSDIYSIGITLYEALSGKTPFDAPTEFHIMEGHLKKNPTKLSSEFDTIPPVIDSILGKALSKSKLRRYHSCEEFYADLDRVPAKPYKAKKLKKKKPAKEKQSSGDLVKKTKNIALSFFVIGIFLGLIYIVYSFVSDFWMSPNINKKYIESSKDMYSSNPSYLIRTRWNSISAHTENDLNSVFFLNDSLGFACGKNSTILKTENGGADWHRISAVDAGITLYAVSFQDEENGLIVGENGTILRTNDRGATWQNIKADVRESLFGVYFFPGTKTGFAVGGNGLIIRTSDGGDTWKRVLSPSHQLLFGITFSSASTGFAVGWNGELLKTTDQGVSWTKQNKISDVYLSSVSFADEKNGIIVGGGGEIYRTTDGGSSWDMVTANIFSKLYSVAFLDKQNGIITGSKGEILITKDSGETWQTTASGKFGALTNIAVLPSRKVIIVGFNGTILASQN